VRKYTNEICLGLLVSLISLSSPATAELLIPEADFKEKVQRIAILPSRIQIETSDDYAAARRIDELVATKLEEAGVDIIPASEFLEVEQATARTMGGSYDAFTGDRDMAKAKTINDLAIREFERLHEFDAYLIASVVTTPSSFRGGRARWDGIEVKTKGSGGDLYGSLTASSLKISVIDKTEADADYMVEQTGIQLLLDMDGGFWKAARFVPVPLEERLTDEATNVRAVEAALAPLIELIGTPVTTETAATGGASE